MNVCSEAFTTVLEAKGLHYNVRENGSDTIVSLVLDNRNTLVIFGGDVGDHVQLVTVLERVPEEKFVDVVLICNQLNNRYRYAKFAVDRDNDVVIRADAILDSASAGEKCFELLIRKLKIIREARPDIMRCIYV